MKYLLKKFFYIFYTPLSGITFLDKIKILLFFLLPRILFSPIKILSPSLCGKIWKKLLKKIPRIWVKFDYGAFLCRKGSADLIHIVPNYEMQTTDSILSFVKHFNENSIFIDVGAHIGRYTIMVGKLSKSKIISIEPEPLNFNALKMNVELNNLSDRVFLINKAAFNKKGIVKLNLENLIGSGEHSIIISKGHKVIKVKCDTLDNLIKNSHCSPTKIKLIKIDVEGSELEVLKGAKNLLKYKPIVIFESNSIENLKSILEILFEFNYKLIKRMDRRNYLVS